MEKKKVLFGGRNYCFVHFLIFAYLSKLVFKFDLHFKLNSNIYALIDNQYGQTFTSISYRVFLGKQSPVEINTRFI